MQNPFRKRIALFAVALVAAVSLCAGLTPQSANAATSGGTRTVDRDTSSDWTALENPETDGTKYIGRIWTDKTVTDGGTGTDASDFNVTLSALSSMSNTAQTSTSDVPLDIVLVLDVSTSMGELMGSSSDATYTHVEWNDAIAKPTVYYVKIGNNYYQASPYASGGSARDIVFRYVYDGDYQYVTRDSQYADDLYDASNTRLNALKTAVNDFVDQVLASNSSGTHRISIVKFANNSSTATGNSWYVTRSGGSTYSQVRNYSQTVLDYTPVTRENVNTIKDAVNSLYATGATRGDYGMTLAQAKITEAIEDSSREDSSKTVIYFSDGEPGETSFSYTVAGNALTAAANLKGDDAGTTIYSVGIFSGASNADPTDSTSNANKFMHGISSNYKDARVSNDRIVLGERSSDLDSSGELVNYYQPAASASELDSVFTQIANTITSGTGSPIHTTYGYDPTTGTGYVTFTDTLGDYMQVDGMTSITVGTPATTSGGAAGTQTYSWGGTITGPAKSDGSTTYTLAEFKSSTTAGTYTFTYNRNIYKTYTSAAESAGNTADILIRVERAADKATGDTVTVQIPASCLPLIELNVDLSANDGAGSYYLFNNNPIQVNYGVSLKSGVADLVVKAAAGTYASTDTEAAAMASYIASNTTSDGKVAFYSNDWSGTSSDPGYTTSSFMPSTTNSFYYFIEDAQLYTRSGTEGKYTYVEVRVADMGELDFAIDDDELYWYKHPYYVANADGTVSLASEDQQWVSVQGFYINAHSESEGLGWNPTTSAVYINEGGIRQGWVMSLKQQKTEMVGSTTLYNPTGTSNWAIDPEWDYSTKPVSSITNALGNNGRITLDKPATLTVSKTVQAAEGFTLPSDYADKAFQMKITLTDANGNAVSGTSTYTLAVKKTDGTFTDAESKDFVNGVYTYDTGIKAGETLCIYGLPAGYKYKVEEVESANAKGYTEVTASSTGKEGTLSASAVQSASIVNEYNAASAESGGGALTITKNYTLINSLTEATSTPANDAWGQDGRATTTFTMCLEAVSFKNVTGTTITDKTQLASLMPKPTGSTWNTSGTSPYITATVNNTNQAANFGELTFTKPGTYIYDLHEEAGSLSGVSYGGNRYRVTFTVTDDGGGQLAVSAATQEINDTSGTALATPNTIDNGTATAYNFYSADKVGVTLSVNKALTDNSGANPLTAGMFTFKVGQATNAGGTVLTGDDVPQLLNTLTGTSYTPNYRLDGVGNDADGNIGLGGLWLQTTNVGQTYYYEFYENLPSGATASNKYTLNGMTYDVTHYRAKVVVTNASGTITATVTYQQLVDGTWIDITGTPTFNNVYNVAQTSLAAGFSVQKTFTGRDAVDGESFTFTATLKSQPSANSVKTSADATEYVAVGDQVGSLTLTQGTGNVNLTNGASATGALAQGITFTKPGTYTFEVKETQPETSAAYKGVTYDGHTSTVTVRVTDVNGQLTISDITDTNSSLINGTTDGVAYNNSTATTDADKAVQNAAAFTNVYNQTEDLTGITASFSKQLTGREMYAGEFSFTMRPSMNLNGTNRTGMTGDSVTITQTAATNAAGASSTVSVPVNALSFTGEDIGNVFWYTITENIPADAVDANNNTYSSYSTPYGTFTKDGITYDANEHMSLIVQVCYDKSSGLYLVVGTSADWDYDNGAWSTDANTVSTKDGGAGTVTIKDENGKGFVNEYAESGSKAATFYKQLTGRAWQADDSFGFTLAAMSNTAGVSVLDMPMPEGSAEITMSNTTTNAKTYTVDYDDAEAAQGSATTTEGISVPVGIDSLTFTAPGTYVYVLYENASTVAGVDDNSVWGAVVYTVTQNKDEKTGVPDGTLDVAVAVQGLQANTDTNNKNTAGVVQNDTFVNSYQNDPGYLGGNGDVKIEATKTLTGNTLEGEDFSFEVIDSKGNTVSSGTNAANGTITFQEIEYTNTKLAEDVESGVISEPTSSTDETTGLTSYTWTYHYTVVEDTSNLPEGVKSVDHTFLIKVTVTDHGDGSALDVAVDYGEYSNGSSKTSLEFTNSYGSDASGAVVVRGDKELYNNESSQIEELEGGEFTFEISGVDEDGTPVSDELLPKDADGNTNTTTTNDSTGTVDFGTITYTFENAWGDSATTTDGDGDSSAVPQNDDNATVILSDPSPVILSDSEGSRREAADGADEDSSPAPQNDDAASLASEDGTRTKTFTYTIKETNTVENVTNDSAKTFTVTVTDNGDGTLTVTTSQTEAADPLFKFTNIYNPYVPPTPTPDPDPIPGDPDFYFVKKVLTGRTLEAGEFSFELVEELADGTEKTISTGTNDASGEVDMSSWMYSVSDIGEHIYVLREVDGGSVKDGVRYTDVTYRIKAVVAENDSGELAVSYELLSGETDASGALVFANVYEPGTTSVQLGAKKVLDGRDIVDGEFSFELRDADGNVVATATNAGSQVLFAALEFDAAGTYAYTVREVAGDDSTITYDENVYTATITVTDNNKGGYDVSVAWDTSDGEVPVFKNTYTAPEPTPIEPDTPTPSGSDTSSGPDSPSKEKLAATGDPFNLGILAGLAAFAGVALCGAGLASRKRKVR